MHRLALKVLLILLLLGAGLAAGYGLGHLRLSRERAAAQEKIGDMERRLAAAQRKATEEKGQKEQLMRARYDLEGEAGRLQEELTRLESRSRSAGADLTGRVRALEERLQAREKEAATLLAEREELKQNHSLARQALAETRKEGEKLAVELAKVRLRLQETEGTLGNCRSHNAELCRLSGELLESYENKGVLRSLLEKEKFTGLKKVELEHFVQEYRDKIDQQRLTGQRVAK